MILCHRPCQNKTEYGYCKTTYCIYPFYNCIPNTAVGYVPTKPKTNAERIRHMTDEELAVEIDFIVQDAFCYGRGMRDKMITYPFNSHEEILEWLQEEVQDE